MSDEEGQRLAGALGGPGKGKALILRNHGLMSVGGTVDEAAFVYWAGTSVSGLAYGRGGAGGREFEEVCD